MNNLHLTDFEESLIDQTLVEVKGTLVAGLIVWLRDKIHTLVFEITELETETMSLQIRLEKMEIEKTADPMDLDEGILDPSACVIYGFRLVQKTTSTDGVKYRKWYATKGKETIYIGNDLSQAAAKILAKHPELSTETPIETVEVATSNNFVIHTQQEG